MKVLFVSTEFPPVVGGISTYAHNFVRALQCVGVSVSVLTALTVGSAECVEDINVIRLRALLNRKVVKILPLLWTALRISCRDRPDKLLAMVWTHDGFVAYLLKKILGINYILVAHGSEILGHQRSPLGRTLMQQIFKGAQAVVANSNFTRDLVVRLGIDPARVVVINPPIVVSDWPTVVDTTEVDEKYDLTGKRVLLTAARLARRKGHAEVIQVIAGLRERYPNLVYVMTGEGDYLRKLESVAKRLGVTDRVRMVGYVSQTELQQLYSRTEIYISPSQEDAGDIEGFGIALMEAGVYGKPVIAGRCGGVTDSVNANRTGILVDASDAAQIQRALVVLLDDPVLREQLGTAARSRVVSEFGLRCQGEKLQKLLSSGGVGFAEC